MVAQLAQYLVPPPPPWLSMQQLAAEIKQAAERPAPKPATGTAPVEEPDLHQVNVLV
ncbi:MAG TPA: hypothetical protein VK009_01460 [Chloroflexota bacterium]|nr:hypothetical protein [Chloroflexota bacterium]